MDEIASLHQQLTQLETLLNLIDAMRPDLPALDLYGLALQAFCDLGDYAGGSLWQYGAATYHSGAWQGLDRQRVGQMPGAAIDEASFQSLLAECEAQGGVYWMGWPMPATVPAPLRSLAAAGHTAIVPLAFTERVGFVALEAPRPAPTAAGVELLTRLGDRVAVALDTARVFQVRQQTIEDLQRLMAEQQVLQATVMELSAPLLPLLPGVLVLPLIGSIDSIRAERILAAELDAIIRERTEVVLVDITGTAVVDTNVAMQLIRSADAARLLGCQTILVGVRPEIAQTLVGLGVDLRGVTTHSTLAEGLQRALRLVRRQIVALSGSP